MTMAISVIYVIVLVKMTSANMASETDPAHDGKYYIQVCFDLTQHKPTCGWKVLISSSYPLTSFSSFTYNEARRDNYSFIIYNKNHNAQLPPNTCNRMTLEGNWGNIAPTVMASWFCICDASTNEKCQEVQDAEQQFDVAVETETLVDELLVQNKPLTLQVDDASVPLTAEVDDISKSAYYTGYNITNPKQISLLKTRTECYVGPTFSTPRSTRSLVDCATLCLPIQDCAFISFQGPSSGRCHLVNVSVQFTAGSFVEGSCEFWDVVAKIL